MPMRLSDHADGAARVRRFARRWYASLRYNLPFAWVYAVNVVLWVTLRRRPFETPEDFPGVAGLAAHDEAIRREFRRLRARTQTPTFGDLDPGQSRLATDRWRALLLWFWGRPAPLNLGDCPETAAALSQIVGLRTAFFSTLEPRTSLPWHMGPYAGVLRVHLGVEVPREGPVASVSGGSAGRGPTASCSSSTTPTPTPRGTAAIRNGWCCFLTSNARCRIAGSVG